MNTKTPSTEGLEYHSPEWFRMCALIEEGVAAGTGWQWRPRGTVRPMAWEASSPEYRKKNGEKPLYNEGNDYRLSSAPRRVWHEYYPDGSLCHVHKKYPSYMGSRSTSGQTFVEFVEVIKP